MTKYGAIRLTSLFCIILCLVVHKELWTQWEKRELPNFIHTIGSFWQFDCLLYVTKVTGYHNIFGHYNPSVRVVDLASRITYDVCLILCVSRGILSLKLLAYNQFLKNFSWQFYLLSKFLPKICWADEILYVFCFDFWPGARSPALCLIS